MKQPLHVQKSSLSDIEKKLNSLTGDEPPLSEEELRTIQNRAEASWFTNHSLFPYAPLGVSLAVLLFSWGYASYTANPLLLRGFADTAFAGVFLLVLSMVVSSIIFVIGITTFDLDVGKKLLADVKPLSDAAIYFYDPCAEALTMKRESALAAAYIDKVVAQGRCLRGYELPILRELHHKDRNLVATQEREKLCKELHGISV